jgi:hypothetical protein
MVDSPIESRSASTTVAAVHGHRRNPSVDQPGGATRSGWMQRAPCLLAQWGEHTEPPAP